ncbi:MAG: acyl carrier protein [Clostridia bacterium]|nr:acyl carrier protein [Clostridia bacterium]
MEFEKIRAMICEQYEIDKDEVTPETVLEDLNFDSLDMIEIAMDIEDEFNVEVPDEALEKFITIGDIVEFLENR